MRVVDLTKFQLNELVDLYFIGIKQSFINKLVLPSYRVRAASGAYSLFKELNFSIFFHCTCLHGDYIPATPNFRLTKEMLASCY